MEQRPTVTESELLELLRAIRARNEEDIDEETHSWIASNLGGSSFDLSRVTNRHGLVTEQGKPFSAAGFGNWFRDMCEQAGIPKKLSAHGLRKAGATRLAEHECTDHQIMAWGGWKTLAEVQRYTREANRKRLAKQAADKLETGTRVANLFAKVSQTGEKCLKDQ